MHQAESFNGSGDALLNVSLPDIHHQSPKMLALTHYASASSPTSHPRHDDEKLMRDCSNFHCLAYNFCYDS